MTNAAIGYGTKFALETAPGTFLFEDLEEVFDVTPPTVSVDSVDVTAIGYENRSRVYAQGLTDNGTVTAQANYIAGGSTDVRVRGLLASCEEVYCRIVFPNGTKVVFLVVVEGYEQSVSFDDKMVSTITLKVNGDVNLLDADDEEINLPPSTGASAISQAQFLPITGGTMQGMLTLYNNPSLPMHASTKSYVDDVFENAGSKLLGTWNTWTNANKFNRTVEFGAYGLIENLWSGCKLSGISTVAKASETYITRLRLVTGNDKTKPSIYFYTYDLATEGTQPAGSTAMFSVDGSKNPAHTGFFNGITAYKNIKINHGLQVDLPNYAAQEGADLHTALYGVYENNSNSALANYSYNDFYGGLYTRGYSLCNFANNHPVFPNSIGWLRGTTVKLDGTTSKYASSVKAAGLIIDKDGHVKYYRSSASATGDIENNSWSAVTDQSESAEIATKGYLDFRFSSDLRTPQSIGATNTNATSMIAASQSGCTVQNGVGIGFIGASGACEISAPTSGQTTAFNSILCCAQSKTSGRSRHCAIIGSQGVEVKDKVGGGIFYGYVVGSSANAANIQFSVEAAGVCTASDFVTANSADYAEFFENETLGVIPIGTLVALNGDKVKIASDGDEIIGVISASLTKVKNSDKSKFSGTPALIGADTPHTWAKRYLTGEFGEALYEEIPDPDWVSEIPDRNWTPSENETESDRPMIANPVEQRTIIQQIENPEYDPERMNIPRSERPEEWSCVGLIGQVHVRIDDTVTAGCYVSAMNGIGTASETKTNLRCMKITTPFNAEKGYGVALCLLK